VTTYKVPDADSACAICGTGFIWLFHPKVRTTVTLSTHIEHRSLKLPQRSTISRHHWNRV